MKNDLISIIIPVFNVEKYIADTINCILNQSYQNWEAILVDDCSTDGTIEIIKSFALNDSRIKLIVLETNSGPSTARNVGLDQARGNYIAYLDSDDLWMDNKLMDQLNFMKKENIKCSFTSYNLVDCNGNKLNREVHVPYKVNYNDLLGNTVISTITVMIEVSLKEYLKMPENYNNGEDLATWLNILKHENFAYGLDSVLSSYRQVDNSLSSGIINRLTRIWKVYRNIEKLTIHKSITLYFRYIWNNLRKRKKSNSD